MNKQRDQKSGQRDVTPSSECSGAGCCDRMDRRQFIQFAGAAVPAAMSAAAIAGPFSQSDTVAHFVPADKKLARAWIETLFAKGDRTWYSGSDLATIGMPIGGIAAGQLYLTGDGRLVYWDIFNQHINSGFGRVNYKVGRKPTERVGSQQFIEDAPAIAQGFAVRVKGEDKPIVRSLDHVGFPDVRFCGEYPIGRVEYADAGVPVRVALEAFSPFIPLNAEDSALPVTIMDFTVTNVSDKPLEVTLAGWLENAVCWNSAALGASGKRVNHVQRGDKATLLVSHAQPAQSAKPSRPPVVFADFEGGDYGNWQVEGEAFGKSPARGTLPRQNQVGGFLGKGLVNTFLDGDRPHGKLISPGFRIERSFISFLVGGGAHKGQTCVNLVVDGKVVHTASGKNNERLEWYNWDVRELVGQNARIEIVDEHSEGWGHINIDQIEFGDTPKGGAIGSLDQQPDFGTMALALLDADGVHVSAALPDGPLPENLFANGRLATADGTERSFEQSLRGALASTFSLDAKQTQRVTFVVSWYFPNRPERGHFYATRFADAADVARYVTTNFERLAGATRLWHDTYYDSTLPHWLLDRLHSTVSTLATSTCQWWKNGRFWAWEGSGCCHGTCGHVWNYAHAVARLFPSLERSVREMQDFSPDGGFIPETGEIRFRGENWRIWAGDSQAGYVLKAFREHQCSADSAFLKRNWPAVRKSLQFLIEQDANSDGLIEGKQHNTYDIDFFGPNPMIGSLYLAALRAGEEMARELNDVEFAEACSRIFRSGQRLSVDKLFNGEYFIQIVDLEEHPKFQHGDGCLSDQLFGQGWACQLGLGRVYPSEAVRKTLESIWKYNWAPDIGPQNASHAPERWFAYEGEAGLFTCTWPKSKYLPQGVRYKNEVWTGIEYQVAGHMAWDGMLTEALAICRAIHDRYHPAKHNPWNEIECGDHYARGMASWGVLIGLSGFAYHGPKGHFAFAPRITPEDFRSVFTGAGSWGTIEQTRQDQRQTNRITVKWGDLRLNTLAVELSDGKRVKDVSATIGGEVLSAHNDQSGQCLTLIFDHQVSLSAGQTLELVVTS